jgi:ribonuclease-3
LKKDEENKLKDLEDKLNYKFNRLYILKRALTHPSVYNKANKKVINNQRLEFLGDSVLELIVNEYIYNKFDSFSEGELSKIKSIIVSKPTLAKWANHISLGEYVLLGKGEDLTGGRNKPSILADCFEAILGAVYIDSDFKKSKKVVLPFLKDEIKLIKKNKYKEDYKTLLQEISQKKMKCLPKYILIKEKGADHKKIFYVEVRLKEISYGSGFGDSKKEAEQNAAENAFKKLRKIK